MVDNAKIIFEDKSGVRFSQKKIHTYENTSRLLFVYKSHILYMYAQTTTDHFFIFLAFKSNVDLATFVDIHLEVKQVYKLVSY